MIYALQNQNYNRYAYKEQNATTTPRKYMGFKLYTSLQISQIVMENSNPNYFYEM